MAEKPKVLLVDNHPKASLETGKALWSAGFIADTCATAQGAVLRLRDFVPDVVVAAASGGEGEALCRRIKKIDRHRAVVLCFEGDWAEALKRADAAGADAFLAGPRDHGALVSCVRLAIRAGVLSRQADELRRQVDESALAPSTQAVDSAKLEFDFFKRLLHLEVRRSKRYHYPLAFLVVGIDQWAKTAGRLRVLDRSALMARLLGVLNELLRDIDMAVFDGEQRFFVCLPETDHEGAVRVAERIRERLGNVRESVALTASVGMASYDGSEIEVTFKGLYKAALACLKRAQTAGGNRVDTVYQPVEGAS